MIDVTPRTGRGRLLSLLVAAVGVSLAVVGASLIAMAALSAAMGVAMVAWSHRLGHGR
jgi:hypothetical protein